LWILTEAMDGAAHKQVGERMQQARELLKGCRLCGRDCGVDRTAGQTGYCGLDDSAYIFREMLRFDEEAELNPSHQVYFAGCNLRCEFCTVAEWNEEPTTVEPMDLGEVVRKAEQRRAQGTKTLNLLGGEPAVSVLGALELLGRVAGDTRVVWNSNMYYSEAVDDLMRGLIDVCLCDLKCGDSNCAEKLLGAGDYVDVARANVLRASKHSDLIIRHLIMPGHGSCCLRPTLEWVAENVPKAKVSLRSNYVPPADAEAAPSGYLDADELGTAVELAGQLQLRVIQ
jgi:putative pyruvate formate lyase activating enzyme